LQAMMGVSMLLIVTEGSSMPLTVRVNI